MVTRSLKNLTITLALCIPAAAQGWTTELDAVWVTTAHFVPLDAIVSKAVTRDNIEHKAVCVIHDLPLNIWRYVRDFDDSAKPAKRRFDDNAVWLKLTQADGTETFVDRHGGVFVAGADSPNTMTENNFRYLGLIMSNLESTHYDACFYRAPSAPDSTR